MRLQTPIISFAARPVFASAGLYCPHCADPMIAPSASEFVQGEGIRHRWVCEACGTETETIIPLAVK